MVCNMQAMYDMSSVFCRASATYHHSWNSVSKFAMISTTRYCEKKSILIFGGMVTFYYDLFNMLNRTDFGLRLQNHPEQTNHHGPDE